MDPVMKAWMFYSWVEDYNDEFRLLENQGYLIGSFINPEAVKRVMGKDGEKHVSSDAEFEETLRGIREGALEDKKQQDQKQSRRRRRKIQG
jgi:hypothetical protein